MPDRADVVMLGTFSTWRRGTLQARALPIAQEFIRRGLQVTIITSPWDEPTEAGVRECVGGVDVINTPTTSPVFSARAVAEQVQIARGLAPRIVHVFKPKGFGGFAGFALARELPLVVDSDDWEGDGGWNRLSAYPVAMRRVFDWQERTLIARAIAVTAASTLLEHRARRIRRRRGSDTVFRVPNGLSDEWFARLTSSSRTPATPPSILVYGRFEEIGADWLPRFIERVAARRMDSTRIRIVGPVDMAALGSSARIVDLLGYVARDVLPNIFASATIAVMPLDDSLAARSKHSVKLLELMASGCPVIASDVGDVPRTLGAAGVLVRGSDPESFADSALELMQDSVRLESMSLAGPPRIRAAFHIGLGADSMLRAYSAAEKSFA